MSDTNSAKLRYVAEVTYGVAPTATTYKEIRYTSDSLAQKTSTTKSDEIRDDRQVADIVRTSVEAGGDIGFELSYGGHDDFLQYALLSAAWAGTITYTATTISAASADNSFNSSASGFTHTQYSWIKVTGFATAANNGYFRITTATTAKLIVTGGTLVTEAAGPSVTVKQGDMIKNGTTLTSLAIEREYTDVASTFEVVSGQCIDGFSMGVTPQDIIAGAFTFLGKKAASGTSSNASGTTAAATGAVMNAVDNVLVILENMAAMSSVADFQLTLKNNLRTRLEISTLGAASVGKGRVEVEGSMDVYFSTATLFNKYLNFTATSLAIGFVDAAGKGYIIELPAVKLTDGSRNSGGANQDIMAKFKFEAYRDSTLNSTIKIFRFP